jgi:NOL1/NOP2/fmu family ribosome biogenesis protein
LPELLRDERKTRLLGYLNARFGIDGKHFDAYDILAFSRQTYLFRRHEVGLRWAENTFVRCGLPFLRQVAGHLKPTTVFVQRFGILAERNLIDLSKQEISVFCRDKEIKIQEKGASLLEAPGYIIVRSSQHVVGVGLLLEEGRLLCRFPRAIREALSKIRTE